MLRVPKLTSALALVLASCSPPGTPSGGGTSAAGAGTPARLTVASWNLEHLAERDGEGCRPRQEADYAALRGHADALGADVIAFQEVESRAAAERVFTPDKYEVVIEGRASSGAQGGCYGMPGQRLRPQKVGFAIRRGVPFTRNPDFTALGLGNDNLRTGVDISIGASAPLRMLAVHLKSGCNSGRAPTDRDCDTLFAQVPVLERWIDGRGQEGAPALVLGDFNRRLASRNDLVFTDLDDGEPAASDLSLASGTAGATCKSKYREFIDFVVLNEPVAGQMVAGSFQEYTYDLPEEQHPSDHCPVSVSLRTAS